MDALGTDDVVAFLRLLPQRRNRLRLILQVAIHHDNPVAVGNLETGGDRMMLPEVPRQAKTADARIGAEFDDPLPGIVRARIADEDHFIGDLQGRERRIDAGAKIGEAPGTPVDGRDDRQNGAIRAEALVNPLN